MEDVVRIYQALLLLPGLTTNLENGGQGNERWTELIEELYLVQLRVRPAFFFFHWGNTNEPGKWKQDHSTALAQLSEMVETTIDLEELDRHNFIIKADFDPGLEAIKENLETVRDNLDSQHREVARDLDMDMDQKVLHFEQHTLYGYCFRLTRKVRHLRFSLVFFLVAELTFVWFSSLG